MSGKATRLRGPATMSLRRRGAYAWIGARYLWEDLAARCGHWPRSGAAPHRLKRRLVRRYAKDYRLRVLLETGTYLGDMARAMAPHFDAIHTIELHAGLYERACLRLARYRNVHCYQGDSRTVLPSLLTDLTRPAVFWLDAHWAGAETARAESDSVIVDELRLILRHPVPGHVVLIDDARYFTGSGDAAATGYPSVETIVALAEASGRSAEMAEDVIRVTPRRTP